MNEVATEKNKKKIKILVVEDNLTYLELLSIALREVADIIPASTLEEAEDKFFQYTDIEVIVMDACVPGKIINTIPLVKKLRPLFNGLMLAASNNDNYNLELLDAGCDQACVKYMLPQKIRGLFAPV